MLLVYSQSCATIPTIEFQSIRLSQIEVILTHKQLLSMLLISLALGDYQSTFYFYRFAYLELFV